VDVIGATRDNLILQDDLLLRESIICTELCVGNLGRCTILILPGMEVINWFRAVVLSNEELSNNFGRISFINALYSGLDCIYLSNTTV
jgi:hypothetical protein